MKKVSVEVREQIRHLVEVEKLPQHLVAQKLCIHRTTVERWCKRLGLKTQSVGSRPGANHQFWKGGRRRVGKYWYIYMPDHPRATKKKVVAEHRLLMEQKLGRYLEPHEVVHHIDGNPENNSLDNLMLFQTNAEHLRHELKGHRPNWTPEGWERIKAPKKRTDNQ